MALGLWSIHIPIIPQILLKNYKVAITNHARSRLEDNCFTDGQVKVQKNKIDGSQMLVQELMPILVMMFSQVLSKTENIRIMQ